MPCEVIVLLQNFVRGIPGLDRVDVETMLRETGLVCAALRNGHVGRVEDAEGLLTEQSLDDHRHDHENFGPFSPYISTSAGTYVEGTSRAQGNRAVFALDTALEFAVVTPAADGWIFYGYAFVLGRPAGTHAEFAEEVRDLHQHPAWSLYRDEGELATAVRIPPRRLRLAEHYSYADVMAASRAGRPPAPDDVVPNSGTFQPPETVSSAREVI